MYWNINNRENSDFNSDLGFPRPQPSALGPHFKKIKFVVVKSVLSTYSSWLLSSLSLSLPYPAGIYLLKVNNRNTIKRCESVQSH